MDFFSKLFSKPKVPDTPAPKLTRTPVVLRVCRIDSPIEITHPKPLEFMTGGWYGGIKNPMVADLDRLIRKTINRVIEVKGEAKTSLLGIPLVDGYHVVAAQLPFYDEVTKAQPVCMVLYIGAKDTVTDLTQNQSLFGPIGQELFRVVQHICIRFNAKTVSITSGPEGDVTVLFRTHDPRFDLKRYFDGYYGNPEWNFMRSDNGTSHGSDSSMENR